MDGSFELIFMEKIHPLPHKNTLFRVCVYPTGHNPVNSAMEEETNKQKALEERKARELETKHSILSQVLDQEARARLNTISVAKPEKASQIENMLIQMAQTGRIRGRLNDKELLGLLEQVGAMQQSKPSVTVKFDRRRAMLDDSDDDY
ncbi:hypothetical protein QYM36_014590 [Artemia franciscana]|uniref:Programmed cell death protein 5 n=2 Tax=Artemia franciscana TaxID=6661 RepID=A0AA88HHD1_ARTSF|nr:hypothetical protein QYM36_014590 [Artemia franciscana]